MLSDLAALFNPQNRRLFKLELAGQADEAPLLIESFAGSEGLSKLFHFDFTLLSERSDIKLKTLMGRNVTLAIELADGSDRYINGHVHRFATLGSDGGLVRYSALMGPWLWMLTCRFDSRIFQDRTAEEVITEVFSGYADLARFEFRLQGELKRHSYITQYRESDFNFVQRLLESEGLFYFFEHTRDTHVLVITDESNGLSPLPEQPLIRYHRAGVTETADSITAWKATRQLQSNRIAVRTFDYRQPRNYLPVSMRSLNQQGDVQPFEIYDFPGQYTHGTLEDGERSLRKRVEALELVGKTFHGDSNCRAMRPGYTFELSQHFLHDRGTREDRDFLLTHVDHRGSNNYTTGDEPGYVNKFVCVRSKIAFRPQLSTRRPTINGPQTAIVVGPPGEEIFTDELGRVKLQFHWDRQGTFNDKSSCWVRVAQAGASGGFGSIQIPRVGDEVVVVFLDGNPDRPLVMGSLYNSHNTPPWSLPANKTQSGFLTRSMKGDGATANFFRFEDKAGAEQIIMHAERNMDTEIELDETHDVGNNRTISVGGTHTEQVKKDTVVQVTEGSYTLQVDNQFIQVSAKEHIILQVGGSSITLTPDGIQIKGKVIVTESTATTQITGAAVRIND